MSGQLPFHVCLPKVVVTTVEMFLKEARRKTFQKFFGIVGGWMDALLVTSSYDTFLLNILSKLMVGGGGVLTGIGIQCESRDSHTEYRFLFLPAAEGFSV